MVRWVRGSGALGGCAILAVDDAHVAGLFEGTMKEERTLGFRLGGVGGRVWAGLVRELSCLRDKLCVLLREGPGACGFE
jgi:hypothetical protein